ncbi:epidermal growth factor receptor isoform X1 [Malaya genurostris]|uniref:epidermal growth factor receptor isoform X1 n=1 Tax=Malaya genurostris TaxID=325434 RepID=UPI0026F3C2F7|nr:epidermal growth factor receptor isoform X1 [Malaya genurostris]
MKGYNTSLAAGLLLPTVLVISVLATISHARERTPGYEAYRNRQQRLQMEREAQLKRLEEKNSEFVKGKICIGTNGRMSVPSNREYHYKNLRDRYTNCTYVDGNLEITWIQNTSYDLGFLQHIREVTGYVLISHVDIPQVILPRLQIIRGRTTFKLNKWEDEFGLFVSFSQMNTLEMPALRDILSGSAGIFNNYNLCHVKTINWDEVLSDSKAQYRYTYNFTSPERDCPSCHHSCEAGCWGEGAHNCQKFSKLNCSPQCSQGRCFGSKPRECCHLFCAGGCTGPTQKDCLACKNFYDDGVCKQECPPMQRYNPTNYLWEPNPEGKYAYGATCVRNCPEHLLKDNGACVRTCPPNKMAQNGECVPCSGACPKTCQGEGIVHSGNIDKYKDCTIIEGSLEILDQTFDGYQQVFSNFSFGPRYIKIHPDRLEVFSTLKEISGFINIQGYHPDFKNLSYFRHLEVVGGRQLKENLFASVYIVKTSLRSLELKSLKRVNSGAIVILENDHLCYAQGIDWSKIKKSADHESVIMSNRNQTVCQKEGMFCDEQCTSAGCWGKGPEQCLECKNFVYKGKCLDSCKSLPKIYQVNSKTCGDCHQECSDSCYGPNADNCGSCVNVKDGKFCVSECSGTKYNLNGTCVACHKTCLGCTGPRDTIAPGGCISCDRAIMRSDGTVERCLMKDEPCPDGYYSERVEQDEGPLKQLSGKSVCRKCHPRCKKCTQYGFHEQVCQECASYKRGEQCEDECPIDHYVNEETRECLPCHSECRGCRGSGEDQCNDCRNLKLYDGEPFDNSTAFNCTSSCPASHPYKHFPVEPSKTVPYCSADQVQNGFRLEASTTPIYMLVALIIVVLSILTVCMLFLYCKQKNKKEAVKMTMALAGCEDSEPLRPTNVGPNLTKLRIIKEAEIRRGGVLGMGAFGRVFKGVWMPEGESVKVPVAIKILIEMSGAESSKEFLDEAYIMASVEHPHLLKLLAVCMTSQLMLITQLMPLGCLLEYVRNNKDKIGSKALLNWSTQIARGMAYLEERRLVHRDLAARNVLVHNPSCVKITDFGLAKLLDYDSDEYRAAGGKMPIKWLALESIRHRVFTSKSDVWSFGVTIWELLTYGARPWENVSAKNVPQLIENGERLQQPSGCTLDIYCILLACWMVDADARPTFKSLAEGFAEMARDPGRYLMIPGDKFMRLPSYTNQDEKDLIRTLAPAADLPGTIVEAEEYLQPKTRPVLMLPPTSMESSEEKPKAMRYSKNALKPDEESDSNAREVGVGGIRLNLPLDEDDYLMPTCQSQAPSVPGYMDLIGVPASIDNPEYLMGSTGSNVSTGLPTPPPVGPSASGICIIPSSPVTSLPPSINGTVNIGTSNPNTTTINNNANNNNNNNNNNPVVNNANKAEAIQLQHTTLHEPHAAPPTQTLGIPLSPTETETTSEHEYYNDLQRELLPLHRNETTV